MLKRILASTSGSNKNGASKIYYNGSQVYKAYIGSSLVYDVTNGRDFDFTYNSANQKFTFTNWKQTVDGVANTTHFLVKDDPTILVDLGAITGHNTTIKNISIPYNVAIANNSLARAFSNCSNLTNASINNPNITNMGYSFSSCPNLISSPFCGDKVTNMIFAYYNCYNLTGQPVVGKNVTNMAGAYANCYSVTGNPVCSNVSVSMFEAFRACKNLTGAPVCSPEATTMLWGYYQCHNIKGSPVCGNKVTDFRQVYSYCYNLTGSPVCGPNVTTMFATYESCKNLTGSPVCGDKVTNMIEAYANCHSITGNPVCAPNVTDLYHTYYRCYNLTGNPVCAPNVTNMSGTYYCCNHITGDAACGDKVTDMHNAYHYCSKLTGKPACGSNVTNFSNAYYYCNNITGQPVCGDSVTNMHYTYYFCQNLTGYPVCGPNVTDFSAAYSRCYNISGPPVYGPNVTNMTSSYYQCYNLTGPAIIGDKVTAAQHAYCNCGNLSSNAYFLSSAIPSVYNCFAEEAKKAVNTIYVPANSTTLNACLATAQTSSLTNTAITWSNQISTNGRYYNTTYNISICPVANVKQVYKENELLVAKYTMNSGANVVPKKEVGIYETLEFLQGSIWDMYFSDIDLYYKEEELIIEDAKFHSVGNGGKNYYYTYDDISKPLGELTSYLAIVLLNQNTKQIEFVGVEGKDKSVVYKVKYKKGAEIQTLGLEMEDTTNDNGTVTRSIYLDASQIGRYPSSIMFNGETNLLTVDKLKIDNIKDATSMFEGCTSLTYVNTNDWDTSKLVNTTRMFMNCSSLTTKKSSIKSETLESITGTGQVRTVYIGEMTNLISIKGYDGNQLIADVTLSDFEYDDYNRYEYHNSYGYVFILYEDGSNSYITLQADAPVTGAMTFTVNYLENTPREGFNLNLSNVKNADYMFANCTSLTKADFEIDIVASKELNASVGRPTSFGLGSIDNFISFSYYGSIFYLSNLEYNSSTKCYRICPGTDTEVVIDEEDGYLTLYAIEIDPTKITVNYKEGSAMRDYGFENIESASHMFDGCTRLN